MPAATSLPEPDAAARAHGAAVSAALARAIDAAGGWMPLEAYLRFVLYAPGLGYYVAGARKFGAAGDFVTAPELSPLFGAALAVEVAAHLRRHGGDVIELGAGTGRLAADLMRGLDAAAAMPGRYAILEVSPDLRERQRATLAREVPTLAARVEWLDALPARWDGVVVMNEVLDAVPPHVLVRRGGRWFERGVVRTGAGLALEDRPLGPGTLRELGEARFPAGIDYASEVNPAAEALVEDLGRRVGTGNDPRDRLRLPARRVLPPAACDGHADGALPASRTRRSAAVAGPHGPHGPRRLHRDRRGRGARRAVRRGLRDPGGLPARRAASSTRLAAVGPPTSAEYVRATAAVQKLLSPAEMGELFKVLALATDASEPGPGFRLADMRHRL